MLIIAFIISLLSFLSIHWNALAIYDPLSVPNNKIGIHIFFPEELSDATKIINNSDKGAWGYVVIPIQANDRNRKKWQSFFDKCVENKVIPIIRVATVAEGSNWVKPNDFDLVDFANFLNDLRWPVQNRYVIFFNEVNRSDEYGGILSPERYADILNNAVSIFKERSQDFFILPAGLDNAAANSRTSIRARDYLWRMYRERPDIFNRLDGWTSHAYPNPDFSSRPDYSGSNKIDSFKYDLAIVKNFTDKKLPVFITEAGWSGKYLSDHQISIYYQYALSKAWSDPNIVTIAPFVLNAQDGPFEPFSFTGKDHVLKEFAQTYAGYATFGAPTIPVKPDMETKLPEPASISSSAIIDTGVNAQNLLNEIYNNIKSIIDLIK